MRVVRDAFESGLRRLGRTRDAVLADARAAYDTSHTTDRAPHVRADVRLSRMTRDTVVALCPALVMGAYNTGYQANVALAHVGRTSAGGWRGDLIDRLGVGYDATSIAACALHGWLHLMPLLAVTLFVGTLCARAFAALRSRAVTPGVAAAVVAFTLCLPPTVPPWQAALGVAFGVLVGREIFGGAGTNFLHPAVAGLAFVYFAYPSSMRGEGIWTPVPEFAGPPIASMAAAGGMAALRAAGASWLETFVGRAQGPLGATSALASLIGGAWLVHRGIASWRIVAGALLGTAAAILLVPAGPAAAYAGMPWHWHVALGTFGFGVVFLATDPSAAAITQAGRWIYGALVGFLVVLLRVASPVHPDGVLLAVLLGGVLAPLIDHAVMRANLRRRRRRRA